MVLAQRESWGFPLFRGAISKVSPLIAYSIRGELGASLAIDRDGLNPALTLGHSLVTGNPVVADNYEFFRQPPAPVYDPEKPNAARRGRFRQGLRWR